MLLHRVSSIIPMSNVQLSKGKSTEAPTTILLHDLAGQDASRPFSPHCWKSAMASAHKGMDLRRVPTPFTGLPAVEGAVSQAVPVRPMATRSRSGRGGARGRACPLPFASCRRSGFLRTTIPSPAGSNAPRPAGRQAVEEVAVVGNATRSEGVACSGLLTPPACTRSARCRHAPAWSSGRRRSSSTRTATPRRRSSAGSVFR